MAVDPFLLALLILGLSSIFALLGIGGAVIYVPLFYWIGIDLRIAIPLALLLNVTTAGSASFTYLKKKMIDFHTAIPFLIFSVIGAPIGTHIGMRVSEETILFIFSVVIVLVGLSMLINGKKQAYISEPATHRRLFLGSLVGIGVGISAGMLGIGGGTFVVPLLLSLGYGIREAPATSSLIVMISSLSGLISHLNNIEISGTTMILFATASLVGSQFGSRIMYTSKWNLETLSRKYFKKIFGLMLIVVAVLLQYRISF